MHRYWWTTAEKLSPNGFKNSSLVSNAQGLFGCDQLIQHCVNSFCKGLKVTGIFSVLQSRFKRIIHEKLSFKGVQCDTLSQCISMACQFFTFQNQNPLNHVPDSHPLCSLLTTTMLSMINKITVTYSLHHNSLTKSPLTLTCIILMNTVILYYSPGERSWRDLLCCRLYKYKICLLLPIKR